MPPVDRAIISSGAEDNFRCKNAATAVVKINEDSPSSSMFKDKFQPAKPSTALKGIARKLNDKAQSLRS